MADNGAKRTPQPIDLATLRTTLEGEGATWRSGWTSMAALTEDVRAVRLGVPLPPAPEVERLLSTGPQMEQMLQRGAAAITAPAAYDARNLGGRDYTTVIKNQGNCGSCVAFGTLATAETTHAVLSGQPDANLDLSEAHLFYGLGPATGASCANGWMPEPALNAMRTTGVTTEDYFPYSSGNSSGATLNADWPNRLAKVVSHRNLTNNPAAIKEHISTRGAVSACFIVFQDFYSYASGVYRKVSGAQVGGHCVSLVGYDDAQRCWIGKNSWGTGWGESGFFRIGYGQCGIDTWDVRGIDALTLRWWNKGRKVLGVWTNEAARNGHVYLSETGWRRLCADADTVNLAMLNEMACAKATGRPVDVFEDAGTVLEAYAY
jgi:C1A family cysteine protease